MFAVVMLALVGANGFAFAHFQDPETPVPGVHMKYQPLQLRSQRPRGVPLPPACYQPLAGLVGSRTVVVPAGTAFPSWAWRYVGLVRVESGPQRSVLSPADELRLSRRRDTRWRCAGMIARLPADPPSSEEPLHVLSSARDARTFFLVDAAEAARLSGGR